MAGDAYITHKHKLVLLWTPKCACTAATDWFLHIEELSPPKNQKRAWLHNNGYLYTYRQVSLLVKELGYKVVQFTRNPYSRSVSAFLNKFCIYQQKPLTQIEMLEPFSRELIKFHNSINGSNPDEFNGLSFYEYLLSVQAMMKIYPVIDHHWDTQLPRDVSFRIKPDFLIRQENFNEDLTYLNCITGITDYIPPKSNNTLWPSNFEELSSDESCENSFDFLDAKKLLRKENLLGSKTVGLINEIYKEDFEFFGYPMRQKKQQKWYHFFSS